MAFQAGGALRKGSVYAIRAADEALPAALRAGSFCVVLAPRQMGKSSLRHRTGWELAGLGWRVVHVDLGRFGTTGMSSLGVWLYEIARDIARSLKLSPPSAPGPDVPATPWFLTWLREDVLAPDLRPMALFLDEIDTALAIHTFSTDDFFGAWRALHDARLVDPVLARLSVCLLGVAMPDRLVRDPARTPFNVAQTIVLEDLSYAEAAVFGPALIDAGVPIDEATVLLEAMYGWTSGNAYMLQRLGQHIEAAVARGQAVTPMLVDDAVSDLFLRPVASVDGNLAEVERRLDAEPRPDLLLRLYRRVHLGEAIPLDRGDLTHAALVLSGLVSADPATHPVRLRVRNRITAAYYGAPWIDQRLALDDIERMAGAWEARGRRDDDVPRGATLADALRWEAQRGRVDPVVHAMLRGAERVAREEVEARRARERAEAQVRAARLTMGLVGAMMIVAAAIPYGLSQRAAARQQEAVAAGTLARQLAERPGRDRDALTAALAALGDDPSQAPPEVLRGASFALAAIGRDSQAMALVEVPGQRWLEVAVSDDGAWVGLVGVAGAVVVRPDAPEFPVWLTRGSQVRSIAFDPSGPRVATAHENGWVRLWELPSGTLRSEARAWRPAEPFCAGTAAGNLSFRPDGGRVLTIHKDCHARTWRTDPLVLDTEVRHPAPDFGGPHGGGHTKLSSAAWVHGDDGYVTTCGDGRALHWRGTEPVPGGQLGPIEDWFTTVAPHPLLPVVAVGDATARVRLWDLTTHAETVLNGHVRQVTQVVFDGSGDRLVSASEDGSARVWATRAGVSLAVLRHGGQIGALAVSVGGDRVATGSEDGRVIVWRADDGVPLATLGGHQAAITALAFLDRGRRLVVADEAGRAQVWTLSAGQPWSGEVADVHLDPGGQTWVVLTDGAVWRSAPGGGGPWTSVAVADGPAPPAQITTDGSRPHTPRLLLLSFAPVRVSPRSGCTRLDVAGASIPCVDGGVLRGVGALSGGRVAVVSDRLRVWHPSTGHVEVWSPPDITLGSGYVFAGYGVIAADRASDRDEQRVWAWTDGGALRFARDIDEVWGDGAPSWLDMVHVPGTDDLLAAFETGDVRRIDGATGTTRWSSVGIDPMIQVTARMTDLLLSPDGSWLVAASQGGDLLWWSLVDDRHRLLRQAHPVAIDVLEGSPDGRLVVTTDADGTALLWDVQSLASGDPHPVVAETPPRAGRALTARFTATGDAVLLGGLDGAIRHLPLTGPALRSAVCRALARPGAAAGAGCPPE